MIRTLLRVVKYGIYSVGITQTSRHPFGWWLVCFIYIRRDSNPERVSGEKRTCRWHVRAAKSAAAVLQGRQTRKRLRPFGRAKRCTVIYRTSFSLLLQTPHPIGLHPWLALLGRDSKEQNVPPAPFAFFRLRACHKDVRLLAVHLFSLFPATIVFFPHTVCTPLHIRDIIYTEKISLQW